MAPGGSDIRILVRNLLAAQKNLAGVGRWHQDINGASRYTRAIELSGEIVAELCVKAYPRNPQPCFRIVFMISEIAVWRVDYTYDDPPHTNSFNRPPDLELGPFRSPHYHSWTDNERFATQNVLPRKLMNARLMPERIRAFDQAFWWFCSETRTSASNGDVPELPRRDTLL